MTISTSSEPGIKNSIADHLKVLADSEAADSKLIIVGINRAGDALVRHAPDLATRIDVIRFEVEPHDKLREVVRLGEEALNVQLDASEQIVAAANGSFYLVQMLCHELCLAENLSERREHVTRVRATYASVRDRVMELQERRFGEMCRTFARGPKFRPSGHAPYLILLKWLAESRRWDIMLRDEIARHPAHRGSVGQVVSKGFLESHASGEDVARALHYDPVGRVLSVEDPQFVFYLRNLDWETFPREVGFANVELDHEYAFALSFAGEDRPLAEALAEILSGDDFVVFYDFNEQHRILGEDVEAFLAPIYAKDSRFVIAVLGPMYGEKRWTRFESEQFKERFGEGHVIPVWQMGARPSAFDETRDIGRLEYDISMDPRDEARRLAEIIKLKYETDMENDRVEAQLVLDIEAPMSR